ncbi:MAG: hypothetical protein WB998_06490 [Solirubrobacteraceae bacterium]
MKQIATFPKVTAALASTLFLVLSVGTGALAASPPPQPSVYTGGVTSLTPTSVILLGALNAKAEPANYRFQYGTTKAYGVQTALQPGGRSSATIHVNQPVGDLAPNTLYHFRIVAYGARGAVIGGDRTFKTPKVPLALSVAASPSPVPFGDTFVLGGTLYGTGHVGRAISLQSNPFPYVQGFKTVGNPELTNAAGAFSFPILGLPVNTEFRVVTIGAPYVVSPVFLESVAVRVGFHVQRVRRNRPGRYYRMYGTVAPAEVGAQVGFQLLRPGHSSLNVGGTSVHSGSPTVSTFSTIVRVRHRGVYQALVKINDGSHVSAYSEPIRIG